MEVRVWHWLAPVQPISDGDGGNDMAHCEGLSSIVGNLVGGRGVM